MSRRTNQDINQNTQPIKRHRVFNNPKIVTRGWYFAVKSAELPPQSAKSLTLCGQHIVLYRGVSGKVYAMDGFCPHMGVDLGLGKVKGENIQCFFHQWQFGTDGLCQQVPCGEKAPQNAKLQTYAVQEQFGAIWVWPDAKADSGLMEIPKLKGKDVIWDIDETYQRECHHHITMINGIDPQHLKTVHAIDIKMDLKIDKESRERIQFILTGDVPHGTWKERLGRLIMGKSYSYQMNYADGCLGGLTMMREVRLFDRFKMPELTMYYAYRPVEGGKTEVTPIYVTEKLPGAWGWLKGRFKLWLTKRLFYTLRGEDGEVYDNIRFKTESLLKIDRPVAEYVGYINQLRPSLWSETVLH